MDGANTKSARITSRNVHELSTFELRQGLIKMGAFDFKSEDLVNHKSLLQRYIKELVKLEEAEDILKGQKLSTEINDMKSNAKSIREERKAEALRRSQERQANPEYFAIKKTLNTVTETKSTVNQSDTLNDTEEQNNISNDPFDNDGNDDPFVTFKSQRNKIFIK